MITQLDPMLPVWTSRGTGYAFALIDYSQEHFVHFVVALDQDGTIFVLDNRDVRFQWNLSLRRMAGEEPDRGG